MSRTNGGIIGKINKSSFGKNTITTQTSTGNITTQPGTQIIQALIMAGGGSGGGCGPHGHGSGGGAGGLTSVASKTVCGNTAYPVTIGAGGANSNNNTNTSGSSPFSFSTAYANAKAKQQTILGNPSAVRQIAVTNSPFYGWLKDRSLDKGIL